MHNPKTLYISLFAILFCYGNSTGQNAQDSSKIVFVQNENVVDIYCNDTLIDYKYQLIYFLRQSEDSLVQKQLKKHTRKVVGMCFVEIFAIATSGIYLINDIANEEFHYTDPGNTSWRRTLLYSSVGTITATILFNRWSNVNLKKAVVLFNNK